MKLFLFALVCLFPGIMSASLSQQHETLPHPSSIEKEQPTDHTPLVAAIPPSGVSDSIFRPTFKLGGFIIGRYTATDRDGARPNSNFDIRLMRLYANGFAWKNIYYRFQLEVNDAPGTDRGPRVLDAFVQWQRWDFLQIRLGQFKRCFGFDNPLSPFTYGMGSFSQVATKLQSLNDRIGEHRSSGRDAGMQIQGDLIPMSDGHPFFHYQVGLYNGQGINHRDVDHFKDLIGGAWVSPIRGLDFGAFGWNGRYTDETTRTVTLNRKRYGLGFKYEGLWSARAEYVHSSGSTLKGGPSQSDGWYVLAGAFVPRYRKIKIYGRWDCYRDDATTWRSLKTDWGLSANYLLGKNAWLQINLTHTYDRAATLGNARYNTIDLEAAARF